ncbi:autotransporter outer membrane beta-barrel domain-containing protein [Pseudovibrio sp. SCP19]|uniref:autotransporter family protein n=1 Tax=Pseudovibrio sp. SCP19 TaxID=3141374 RepID=UPI00333C2ED1
MFVSSVHNYHPQYLAIARYERPSLRAVLLSSVVCVLIMIPAGTWANDIGVVTTLKKPTEDPAYDGHDGSDHLYNIAVYHIGTASDVTGEIKDGQKDNPSIYQAWDVDAYDMHSGTLHIAGIYTEQSSYSNIDISLYISRYEGPQGDDQSLELYGIQAFETGGNITLYGKAGSVTKEVIDGKAAAEAKVNGISGDSGTNDTKITVTAEGGIAEAKDTSNTATHFSTESNASASAYGVGGRLTKNAGEIVITARAGSATTTVSAEDNPAKAFAKATASGIIVSGITAENSGDLTVKAVAGIATVSTSGKDAHDSNRSDAIAIARGASGNVSLNSGAITVQAEGGTGRTEAYAHAWGVDGNLDTNENKIEVFAEGGDTGDSKVSSASGVAEAHGVEGDVRTNSSIIIARAIGGEGKVSNAKSYGVKGALTTHGELGEIEVFAKGGEADVGEVAIDVSAEAFGIYEGATTSSGGITVEAVGGTGLLKFGNGYDLNASAKAIGINGDTTNSHGEIKVTARGGAATDKSSGGFNLTQSQADATAYGLKGKAENITGDIIVTAIGGSASVTFYPNSSAVADAAAYGVDASGVASSINNSSRIAVSATAGREVTDGVVQEAKATAYGIYSENDLSLHSSGLISAEVDGNAQSQTYQVYVEGTNATITGYSLAFGSDLSLAEYVGAIKADAVVFENADLSSSVAGAKLYAHTTNETRAGKAYVLPNLVDGGDIADQTFGEIELKESRDAAAIPGSDWEVDFVAGSNNSQVIFNYTPESSTPQQSSQVQAKVLMGGRSIIQRILQQQHGKFTAPVTGGSALSACAEPSAVRRDVAQVPNIIISDQRETSGEIFVTPYHSLQSGNANPAGYGARTTGFIAGYNHQLTENLTVGVSGFYASSDIDYTGNGYKARSEETSAYGGGAQFAYTTGNFRVLGLSTYSFSENDYRDAAATNLESASYNSRGMQSSLNVQYTAELGRHLLVPELGLLHQWTNSDAFTTDNQVAADTTYGAINDHELDMQAKLS